MVLSGLIEEQARAKVNVALHVTGRRADGYHLLDSIVAFADLCDRLSVAPARSNSLRITGPQSADLDPRDNLVLRAREAMAQVFGALIPNIAVELDKHIPLASGLGGGSADAAATLRALCRLTGLDHGSRAIHDIALSLGADVPACLGSRACRMQGIGDGLEPLAALDPLHVVLANAGPALATAEVFAALGLAPGETGYPPLDTPCDLEHARNDLTPAATRLLPVIGEVLAALRAAPKAKFARMSGSGGTCFAVFSSPADAEQAAAELASRHPDWWIRRAMLS